MQFNFLGRKSGHYRFQNRPLGSNPASTGKWVLAPSHPGWSLLKALAPFWVLAGFGTNSGRYVRFLNFAQTLLPNGHMMRSASEGAESTQGTPLGREGVMPLYRLYTLGDDGHISRPATILDCEQDQEAVEAAKRQVDGHAVELFPS
jgi:hypothetical protein